MAVKIYLDDIRIPTKKDWVVVKDYGKLIDLVNRIGLDNIDIISLDHDLGLPNNNTKEMTGYDAAKWLIEKSMDDKIALPKINVHSLNPVGVKNIKSIVDRFYDYSDNTNNCSTFNITHTVTE